MIDLFQSTLIRSRSFQWSVNTKLLTFSILLIKYLPDPPVVLKYPEPKHNSPGLSVKNKPPKFHERNLFFHFRDSSVKIHEDLFELIIAVKDRFIVDVLTAAACRT